MRNRNKIANLYILIGGWFIINTECHLTEIITVLELLSCGYDGQYISYDNIMSVEIVVRLTRESLSFDKVLMITTGHSRCSYDQIFSKNIVYQQTYSRITCLCKYRK